jgi:predicted Zn finger-like uncharacterized protein
MPIDINCPSCGAVYRILEENRGRMFRCQNCQHTFVGGEPSPSRREAERRPTAEDRSRKIARSLPPPLPTPEERSRKIARSVPPPLPSKVARTQTDCRDDRRSQSRRDDDHHRKRSQRTGNKPRSSGGWKRLIISAVIAGVFVAFAIVAGHVLLQVVPGRTSSPVADGTADGSSEQVGSATAPRYRWADGQHVYSVRVEVEHDRSIELHDGYCVLKTRKESRNGATGTGFVVNVNGYLITCAHVVADATAIEVALGDRKYQGKVVTLDRENDLAVLQIDARNLPTLPLGNSDAAETGAEVRALGFPLASLLGDNLKVTRGTLSGVNKYDSRKIFQIDAAINPGNSGGPLVTESGTVIGINRAKLASAAISNVGFATPVNEAKRLLSSKGVTFNTESESARLDGPMLVKRTSPAIALIHVTLPEQGGDDLYHLRSRTRLDSKQKSKEREGDFMPAPSRVPPAGADDAEIDMESTGQILQASGGTQLPAFLGDVTLFLIDPFPRDIRATRERTGTCTLTVHSAQSSGDSEAKGPPSARRGKNYQAEQRTTFSRGKTSGNMLTIQKRYEMKTDPTTGGASEVHVSGEGTVAFDLTTGVPRTVEFKGTVLLSGQRSGVVLTYKLLEGAERDRVLKQAARP